MVKGIRVHKVGGPEAIVYEEFELPPPGPGEIRVQSRAIGVNFIDVYYRTGLYPTPQSPFVPGSETARGRDRRSAPGVTGFRIGDRVASAMGLGGYAEERNMPAAMVVKLPDAISYETAAAMMLKGLTAQYLLRRTYKVKAGDTILFHAAAGGVGLIACQWAKHLGATVIGTVGDKAKARLAKKNGCDHVILYREEDWVARVAKITKGEKCHVVYDGVGKATSRGRWIACARSACSPVSAAPRDQSRTSAFGSLPARVAVRDAADAVHARRPARQPRQDGQGSVQRRVRPARSRSPSTRR